MADRSQSEQSEGGLSAEIMGAGHIAEFHKRLSALEKDSADLRAKLDAAQNSGEVAPYPGFGDHVVHVMQKHFFHDKPEGFDAKFAPRSESETSRG